MKGHNDLNLLGEECRLNPKGVRREGWGENEQGSEK